jgi:SAM-dependent methyltransferase
MSYFPLQDFLKRAMDVRATVAEGPAREIYDRTIASVDPQKVKALQKKYRKSLLDFDPIGVFKYADLPFWIARNVALAQRLGLDNAPPMRLLDIGMGAGHFAAVAQGLGHQVTGTDIAVPLYDDIAAALSLDRRILPVVRGAVHPNVGGPFDRVAIIWQVFDYIRTFGDGLREYWPLADWQTLIGDLAKNHVHPNGLIHLELNPHIQGNDSFYDQDLLDFCAEHGADMTLRDLGIVDLPVAGLLKRKRRAPAR